MSLDTKEKKSVGPKIDSRWEDQRQREAKLVKGVFQCHEPKGGSVKFAFKKFKGDPVATYEFFDGQTYEIPLAVAKHLNENCNYPVYAETLDQNGLRHQKEGKRVQRFNFVRLFNEDV